MSDLSQLAPQPLWQWFEKICSFPRPSGHEAALSQFIQNWARDKQLEVIEEAVGNLIIRKPATPGMENRKPVVIQAHMDMVPQKNADKTHDFTKDPIEPWVDGEWVKARGTTLGADNGIGMCSALAILQSDDIAHGPLEVLLTVDEESGMTGAFGLQPGVLRGEILINTDSEQEGEIYMGCAGGVDAALTLPLSHQPASKDSQSFRLMISGLKGGHSGVNIHLGRGNANKLLARFLFEQSTKLGLQLIDFQGGTLRNAIPREADAGISIAASQVAALQQAVSDYQALLRSEFAIADAGVKLTLTEIPATAEVMTMASQQQLLALLNACPNGVIRMSDEVEGVTETSLNLGVVSIKDQKVTVLCLVRSLIDSGRDYVCGQLSALASLAGAEVKFSGAYPGWKPDNSSPIMAIVRDTYQHIYHKEPVIMVIHAGLECGLFKKPYPDMDMVSIGPTIRFPHSPDEMVNITTVGQYWQLLLAVLQRVPEKV
ncbi:MAG: dipeptidase [Shewanella sp.]|uniref:aminoacyl-histidine dipeptidase n=1 Tax=Shewanella TaxID=22 RepID=UPI001678640E|nr:aminoacyl-histidine dipeptidase [Shewanella fodinae]MBO1270565.1 aminoacyl-histidine dipeptidase [Shewanella sp. 4t3-1-2LB]MCL2907133.1 aminoacyl-histidine dipeptidase [Shewanella fodinae]MDN5369563.1 dipeptidase [Shewanella sp.]GGZ06471.1 aminoacyl-histidine dipeptidase [Shewanella fodinae]